jgi:hypothetical protein
MSMNGSRILACALAPFGALALLGAHVTGSVSAAPAGGSCSLNGQALLTPGLNASSQAFSYSFNGALTGCQGSGPATGHVSAGEVVTIGAFQYQEPVATGTGGCGSSTTAGDAIVTWAGGTTSVIGYTTSGAAAAVALKGSVIPSITLQPLPGQTGATPVTVTSTQFAGYSSAALLAFQPPDPTACNTAAGVTKAGISGQVSVSSASG